MNSLVINFKINFINICSLKRIRPIIFFISFLIIPLFAYSQNDEFFFSYHFLRYVHANPKCNFKLTSCVFSNGGGGFTRGMAVHPEGFIVGLQEFRIRDKKGCVKDSILFYKLEFNTCTAIHLQTIVSNIICDLGTFFYIDYLGRYYVTDIGKKNIYRTNFFGDTLHLIKNIPQSRSFQDLLVIKDRIYLVDVNNIIYTCDTNLNILNTQQFLDWHIGGFTNIHYSCDSSLIIIGTTNTTHEENERSFTRPGIRFFSFDLINNKIIDSLCFYNNSEDPLIPYGGLMSYSEFLASDPECDLLIDLDRNNSSGLFPYDYQASAALCLTADESPLCDQDLYLQTSFP